MPIDQQIVTLLRNEIGMDRDFVDQDADLTADPYELGSLEDVYTDPMQGNFNILATALIVWRKRLADMNARAFDVTKEGSWLARTQRVRFLQGMVKKYEIRLSDRPRSKNNAVVRDPATTAEFS